MDKKGFTIRFRELYVISGFTSITQFAKRLEMNRQTVDRYYNGDRCPDVPALAHICERMGVSADWLLGLSDVREPSTELRAVCNYTGLSEEAVNRITNNDDEWPLSVGALSHLIVSYGFGDVIESYNAFLDLLGKIEHKPAIDNLSSYQQRDDGTIEMNIYEAIHHYMNKATMAFNSVCGYEFGQRMEKMDDIDYSTPEELAKMEAISEELADLTTMPRGPGESKKGKTRQKPSKPGTQSVSRQGRQK